MPRHNRRKLNPPNRSQCLIPHPLDKPQRTQSVFVMYATLSTRVAPSANSSYRFVTQNPNILMERKPIPTAASHVLPRCRTRLRQAETLLRGERAARLPRVPNPTCATYVAFYYHRLPEPTDNDVLSCSTATSSPSITMGRRPILSVANLAHSKQKLQESQVEEHP